MNLILYGIILKSHQKLCMQFKNYYRCYLKVQLKFECFYDMLKIKNSQNQNFNIFFLNLLSGSFDQSPNLCDVYSSWAESTVAKQPRGSEELDEKMKENLAEAMLESPIKDGGPSSIPHGK